VITGLQLHNIALIDSLQLDFEPGFTVLTGETGAGKSILLDALDALLGGAQGAAGVRLLRNGCDRARIEATFLLTPAVNDWLRRADFDVDDDDDLLLSREWRRQDDRFTSRSRLNGVAVNRQQLQALRPLLIDLTVQGQTQLLSRPGQQRRWLDRLGGEILQQQQQQVSHCWRLWSAAAATLQQRLAEAECLKQQRQEQQELLDALDQADLDDPSEDKQLELEQDRLVHGVRLQEGLSILFSHLRDGADQVPSLLDHCSICIQELQAMAQLDGSLQPLKDCALDLEAGLEDLLQQLDSYGMDLESEPERLDQLQGRLAELKRLQRRHGMDLAGLIQRRNTLRERLAPEGIAADLEQLKLIEESTRHQRDEVNTRLHQLRLEAGIRLEKSLMALLPSMGLANVRFQVELTPIEPSEQGCDQVHFLFSANPGQPLAPLVEVASGGEMSRFLLALKTTLAAVDGSSTLLFDEIDAGVSGRISGAMGELLHALARHRQVFCVTHQPLVAAVADHHFRVSKHVLDGVTRSEVSQLRDTQQRRDELAELAGGDQASAYASSLLERNMA
tara:strand:- start:361 stop:2046 length:1686 start_codon:yes stop_codon:yes gene_type:complete